MELDAKNAILNQKLKSNIENIKKAKNIKNAEAEEKKLKDACSDFESIFVEMMLKNMRNTLPGDSIFDKGLADDIYQTMHDQKLSEKIARGRNNFGLGDSLYRQLTRNKQAQTDPKPSEKIKKQEIKKK